MVALFHLQQMRQDRDEPARTSSARLKGQATPSFPTEMSLDETIRFIKAKESGKRSAGRMHYNPATVPTAVQPAAHTSAMRGDDSKVGSLTEE